MTDKPSLFKTWGKLLRLPNLFTVPGDAMAGGLLVSGGILKPALAGACGVVILLYMAGLLLNDYFDRKEDAEERPDRPIPAGDVTPGQVLVVGVVMTIAAIALAFGTCGMNAGYVACGLALCVFLYDVGGRKIPFVGQVLMGSCRAGSVAVGALAMGTLNDWSIRAIVVALGYTAALTVVAAGETSTKVPKRLAFFPGLFLAATAVMIFREAGPDMKPMPAVILMAWGAVEATLGAIRVARGKLSVPPFIGRLIRVMLTTQAAWIMLVIAQDTTATIIALVIFLVTRYLAAWASKHFYGS